MFNLFKNKLFIILLLFIMILNILGNSVKAVFTDDFPDMIYPDGISPSTNNTDVQANQTRYVCNKVLVKYKGNNSYYIINYISANYSNSRRLYITTNNIVEMEGILYKQYLRWNGSSWSYAGWSGYSGGNASNVSGEISYITLVNNSDIISSSKDIYTDNTFTEIFFLSTPLETITSTLVEETEKAQIMEQMKKMIVGFLKYLAVLVISLLAFWKGWQFLSMQLRKA